MRMRTVLTALCVLPWMPLASGDEVRVGRLAYSGATIIGVKDCVLSFTAVGGKLHNKHFSEITGITIDGQHRLNEAERLIRLMQSSAPGRQAGQLRAKAQAKMEQVRKLRDYAKFLPQEAARLRAEADSLPKQVEALRNQAKRPMAEAKRIRGEADKLKKQGRSELDKGKRLDDEARKLGKKKKKERDKKRKEADEARKKAKSLSQSYYSLMEQVAKHERHAKSLLSQAKLLPAKAAGLRRRANMVPKEAETRLALAKKLEGEAKELLAEADKVGAPAPKAVASRYPEAIRAYNQAVEQEQKMPFIRPIIEFRRLSALERAGWIDAAVAQWMAIADRQKDPACAAPLRPRKLGAKSGRRNANAIRTLAARKDNISNQTYRAAVVELLTELYDREEMSDELIALTRGAAPAPTTAAGAPQATARATRGRLLKAKALLAKKEYAQAEKELSSLLHTFGRDDLPLALVMLGKAQLGRAVSAGEDEKRALMLRAGLNFMRVAAHFPARPEAPEALYLAGTVMQGLPGGANPAAAANAYRTVVQRHKDSAITARASAALKALEKSSK